MVRRTVPRMYLLPFLLITLFTTQLGLSLADLPSIKLMQDIICKTQLDLRTEDLLPEVDCRNEAVQRELNIINMGVLISSTIGGTYPYLNLLLYIHSETPKALFTIIHRSTRCPPLWDALRSHRPRARPCPQPSQHVHITRLRDCCPLAVGKDTSQSYMGCRRSTSPRGRA